MTLLNKIGIVCAGVIVGIIPMATFAWGGYGYMPGYTEYYYPPQQSFWCDGYYSNAPCPVQYTYPIYDDNYYTYPTYNTYPTYTYDYPMYSYPPYNDYSYAYQPYW